MGGNYIYSISKKEIDRRITAFSNFLIFLLEGLVVFSLLLFSELFTDYSRIWILNLFLFILFLILFRLWIVRFFKKYLQMKIILNNKYLERISAQPADRYLLSDIVKIRIKRSTRGTIRDVGIWFKHGQSIFLDGITEFGNFKKKLIRLSGVEEVKESQEKFDYDHPAFYPILGTLSGLLTVFAIKFFLTFNIRQLNVLNFFVAAYTFILGTYFILVKPFVKRYGEKLTGNDIFVGTLMFITSLVIYLLTL